MQEKKKKKNRGQSVLRRIRTPFLAVMFFQVVLVYGMFYLLDVTNELKEGAVDLLVEKTVSRSEQFDRDMPRRWGDIGEYADMVTENLDALLISYDKNIEDFSEDRILRERLLTLVASEFVYVLHKNNVAGVFLALDGGQTDLSAKSGLYFRDTNSAVVMNDYSDIVTVHAPEEIADRIALGRDERWTPGFITDDDDLWYKMPFDAAKKYPALSETDLGYWSVGFGDRDAICFSVPLLYKGSPYGVMGVVLNSGFTKAILLGTTSFTNETGYILAIAEPGAIPGESVSPSLRFSVGAADGFYANAVMREKTDILLISDDEFDGLYKVGGLDGETPLYAVKRDVRVYNPASPFVNRQWAVIGIQSENSIFGFAHQVNTLMLIVFIAFLVIGVVGIIIVARVVSAPMGALTRQLRGKDPNAEIKLNRLGINEIDELSEAIEYLSVKVADANRKLADLLELSETSLAVFEYHNRNNNRIIYTRQFAERFGLAQTDRKSMRLREFMQHMRSLKPVREFEPERRGKASECIIRVNYGGVVSWLRITDTKESVRRAGVITDVTREIADRRRLEYERDYDMLTDVYNRRAFHAKMSVCFNDPAEMGVAAIIMLDLDNLKTLNDTYGHDYGDRYIRLTADVLKNFSSERTVVARLAGDEFVVFFHGFDDKDRVRSICEHIKSDMNRAFLDLPDGSGTAVQISAGIAWYPDDSDMAEELMRFADFAMYMVKKTNKGQFREFDFGVYNKHAYLLYNKGEFDDIIENEKLHYTFQPIVDAATGDIFAYEALLRPEGENIHNPSEFISLAKAHSRLEQIECITFRKAMEAFSVLDVAKETNCKIFINTIANQKMPDDLEQMFEERFSAFLSRVVCEITESELSNDSVMRYKLNKMRELGMELALDDFGSGYNSESTMLKYPPQYLKIDMMLIKNIHADADRQSLTKNLIEHGKKFGIRVLAEGVELKEEMEYLINAGIDLMQGFYLCQPMVVPPLELPEIKSEIAAVRARR
ncbi:MAG: bifunctional diguanylate cyclase/phosphodiesterase [Clostridiales Family XIII bacterium]|nr:bifunctional diguanylate cyclase/phosphodiesterase [Clostridiales Family XIII bacterium]